MIYVNGRFLTQNITGVQRYGIEVLRALDNMVEPDEIMVLTPPGIINEIDLKNIKIKSIGRRADNLWVQITLPLYALRKKGNILTMSGMCPIVKPDYAVAHDVTAFRYPESFSRIFVFMTKIIFKTSLRRCKRVFTVSDFSKRELMETLGLDKDKLVKASPSSTHFVDRKSKDISLQKWGIEKQKYYLCVGSQNIHKNQKFIHDCAALNQDKTFVVVGSSKIKTFTSTNNGEADNIRYTDYVSDAELTELYKNAYAFIFPSLYEGFGIPPLEAITLGIRHIALSNIEVFHEIYPRGVYYFDPLDAKAFSMGKLDETFLTDEDVQYYKEKYTWQKTAETILNVIRES